MNQDNARKIICIGLPKTGTTSLHHAVEILGFKSVHWPRDPRTVDELRRGHYRLSVLDSVDMVSDTPIPAIFPQLDAAFPGSKFILTTRDRDSWLTSQDLAGFNQRPTNPGSDREFYRTMLYGVNTFNAQRFAWVYDQHHELVERYFSGARARDLLTIDIGKGGANWGPLCEFLERPIPEIPFPHSNQVGEDQAMQPDGGTLLAKARRTLGRLTRRG